MSKEESTYSIELWIQDCDGKFFEQEWIRDVTIDNLGTAAAELAGDYGLDLEFHGKKFELRIYEHSRTRREFNIIPPVKTQIALI